VGELMSESQRVLYNKTGNDENYTPAYAVKPILKYIPKDATVWCPFDTENSEFVKLINTNGNEVIYSHINTGGDFFEFQPKHHWDMIISNPPFSNKKLYFERALSFNKPFALLMTVVWLNDSTPKKIFFEQNKQMQLLLFNKRIKFKNPTNRENNKITFSSAYYCYNFLPNDLMYAKLV
jgi:hypothetical protein